MSHLLSRGITKYQPVTRIAYGWNRITISLDCPSFLYQAEALEIRHSVFFWIQKLREKLHHFRRNLISQCSRNPALELDDWKINLTNPWSVSSSDFVKYSCCKANGVLTPLPFYWNLEPAGYLKGHMREIFNICTITKMVFVQKLFKLW